MRSLVAIYDRLNTPGAGRPSVQQVDVLRAAVILLHATLEDAIRTMSEELLPEAGADVLNKVGFPDGADKTKETFRLGDLHAYKGRSVDDVIQEAIRVRLQRSNYNSVKEVAAALERIDLDPALLAPDQAQIDAMMRRRHLIVHRADKNPAPRRGRGVPLTVHLPKPTVEAWMGVVEDAGIRMISALPSA